MMLVMAMIQLTRDSTGSEGLHTNRDFRNEKGEVARDFIDLKISGCG